MLTGIRAGANEVCKQGGWESRERDLNPQPPLYESRPGCKNCDLEAPYDVVVSLTGDPNEAAPVDVHGGLGLADHFVRPVSLWSAQSYRHSFSRSGDSERDGSGRIETVGDSILHAEGHSQVPEGRFQGSGGGPLQNDS